MTFEYWLQSRLTAHGFPVGPIDGDIGPLTIAALETFQKAKGLPVTSKVDAATEAALRLSSSAVPQQGATGVPNRDPAAEKPSPVPKPGTPARYNNWPRQPDVPKFYGQVGTNQKIIEIPFDMYLTWPPYQRVRRMSLHTKVADSALRVFENIATIYNARERAEIGIDKFGGSLNVRKMRRGTTYSMHSWGIAIDFDPARNGLDVHSPQARLSHADAIPFWKAWETEGWISLGRARNFDWMHVQAARL
jgi:peptidoglycan hydrolase-like protein with peptidoglycan-binding domain